MICSNPLFFIAKLKINGQGAKKDLIGLGKSRKFRTWTWQQSPNNQLALGAGQSAILAALCPQPGAGGIILRGDKIMRQLRWTQPDDQSDIHNCTILLTVPNRRPGMGAGFVVSAVIRRQGNTYLYAIQYKQPYAQLVYRHNIPGQPNADDNPIGTLAGAKAAVQEIMDNDFLPRLQKALCRPRMPGQDKLSSTEGTLTYAS